MLIDVNEMRNIRMENLRKKREEGIKKESTLYFEIMSKCKRYIDDVILNVIKAEGFKSYTDGDAVYVQSFGIDLGEWIGNGPNRDQRLEVLHKLVGDTVEDIVESKVSSLICEMGDIEYVKTLTHPRSTYLIVELELHWF